MVISHWSLVKKTEAEIGHWSLVISHWSLVMSKEAEKWRKGEKEKRRQKKGESLDD